MLDSAEFDPRKDDRYWQHYEAERVYLAAKADADADHRATEQAARFGAEQSCWVPEDLSDVLYGEMVLLKPTALARVDGKCLLYQGLTHSIHGTSGAAKSWLALHAVAQELTAGNRVLYIDYESSKRQIAYRLRSLGVLADSIKACFDYIPMPRNPETLDVDKLAFAKLLDNQYTLSVVDGANISIGLCGLKTASAEDIALWHNLIINPIAERTGAAVAAVDHIAKGNETNGFAFGSQHKLAGLTGAAYTIERIEQAGRGRLGVSSIRVGTKDREGFVHEIGVDDGHPDGLLVGQFLLNATAINGDIKAAVMLPNPEGIPTKQDRRAKKGSRATTEDRPTQEMEMVSAWWEEHKDQPDKRSGAKTVEGIRARCTADELPTPAKNRLEKAARILTDPKTPGGPWAKSEGPQGRINTNLKLYTIADDPKTTPDTDDWAERYGD